MASLGEHVFRIGDKHFVVNEVQYDGTTSAGIFSVDQSAERATALHVAGGTNPAVTLNAASGGLKVVDLDNAGTAGRVWIITFHGGSISSFKP